MPKVLLYITSKFIWTFLFWGTDLNENRAHVHVGKKGTENFAKIWLEPQIQLAKQGDLSDVQIKQVLKIVELYRQDLLKQWNIFKKGGKISIIKIHQ
ncbi:MAG: DUF4160 domain-containing protein [Paludibacteraceae bacterium]|nr:DUF4160 domain-containing protein [Paludibacteraceae bacterium]